MREITQCTRHVAAWALQGPVLHSGVGSRTSVVATAKRGISMKISSKLVFSSDGNQVLDRGEMHPLSLAATFALHAHLTRSKSLAHVLFQEFGSDSSTAINAI